eukprot:2758096-Pleurochrysis_carterae.AAC.3
MAPHAHAPQIATGIILAALTGRRPASTPHSVSTFRSGHIHPRLHSYYHLHEASLPRILFLSRAMLPENGL